MMERPNTVIAPLAQRVVGDGEVCGVGGEGRCRFTRRNAGDAWVVDKVHTGVPVVRASAAPLVAVLLS
jgi:hypothetical protein